ncbi:MAG: hypothetical protein JXL80_08250 [Planctomycetes bacterium]|nr:hypothetical protein [Planctomycetota bacterium]
MTATLRFLLAAWVGWLGASGALAAEVVERYDDGKVKEKYTTDAEGRKHGKYLANFPSGKIWVRGEYKAGQMDGLQTRYWESGKVNFKAEYRDGKRHGGYLETDENGRVVKEQVFWNDQVLYPKSVRQIKSMLDELLEDATEVKCGASPKNETATGDPTLDPTNLYALGRLNAYRYLCDVPCDVALDARLCDSALAGARICERIGHLDHHPQNPGMPEDEYRRASSATASSNLHMGGGTKRSVDGYMDDSDPSNIAVVGHRRWCLNPRMALTGFGESGKFSDMMAHDCGRKDVPDYDFVSFPPRGYMPIEFFGRDYAWHVSVNPQHYRTPDPKTVKIAIWPLRPGKNPTDADPERRAKQPLMIDYQSVDLGGYGISNAIIFRPKLLALKEGDRYWVEITGLARSDGSEASIEYIVEFFRP